MLGFNMNQMGQFAVLKTAGGCAPAMDIVFREYTQHVQAKFFRTGLYTHLAIDMPPDEEGHGLLVKWVFTFQDLGSTHILSRTAKVELHDTDQQLCVDGVACCDLAHAETALFQGHYADYVRDLYAFEGIST
jgi:hypothetical protein